MNRTLKYAWLSLLNAIFVKTKCEIEILSFSIHNSCNNTIFALLTTYSKIVCMTFVDRLQLCYKNSQFCKFKILLHFQIWRIWCTKHAIHRYFLRLTLMRNIFRIKHFLHDAFYHNLRILAQYMNRFNSIHTYHIYDCVYYV